MMPIRLNRRSKAYRVSRQTVELRSPDGSADVTLLMAGIAVAIQHGLEDARSDGDGGLMSRQHTSGKKRKQRQRSLSRFLLPVGIQPEALLSLRKHFEKDGIFPAGVIDALAVKLKSYKDKNLSELYGNNEAIAKLVKRYLHCG